MSIGVVPRVGVGSYSMVVTVGVVPGDGVVLHGKNRGSNPFEPVSISVLLAFEWTHPSPQSA